METTPSSPPPAPVGYLRLNVWAFCVASALTALILGLIAWPIEAVMFARAAVRYGWYGRGQMPGPMGGAWHGMAGPHAGYLMVHHNLGPWHLLALLILLVWAGIAGAILAAIYNAFVRR